MSVLSANMLGYPYSFLEVYKTIQVEAKSGTEPEKDSAVVSGPAGISDCQNAGERFGLAGA